MFVFKDFASKVRLSPRDVATDNLIFRLHYRLTFWFLLACGILVSSRQFINSHINCITGTPNVQQVLNTFCFFSSTFTVSKYYETNYTGHPGVGQYNENDEIVRHAYYQWVPFVLFLQAIMFVLPHKIWKSLENNRLRNVVKYVESSRLIAQQPVTIKGFKIDTYDKRESNANWLNTTYLSWRRFRINRDWAFALVFCEILNFLNLILQIYLNEIFLQGKFIELGFDIFIEDSISLSKVFPKVTKCIFHKYGPSGSIQNHDAICIMALNIINEKIYAVMWFWFASLLILDISGILWRILTIFCHKNRYFNILVWGEISPGPAIPKKEVVEITNNLWFSDWLFLYYLGKNINSDLFRRLVTQLTKEVQAETKKTQLIQNETGENSESFC